MFVNNETIFYTESDIQHQILARSTDMLCPSTDYQLKITYGYWIGGVVAPCIELIGLVLNSIAVQILATRNSMKNTFNNLLISLFFSITFILQYKPYRVLKSNWRKENKTMIGSRCLFHIF